MTRSEQHTVKRAKRVSGSAKSIADPSISSHSLYLSCVGLVSVKYWTFFCHDFILNEMLNFEKKIAWHHEDGHKRLSYLCMAIMTKEF